MAIEHADLLKLWLVHNKRLIKLQEIQRNIVTLMAHYKLECLQKNNKSISTLSLINDAVTEMESLLEQGLTAEDVDVAGYAETEMAEQNRPKHSEEVSTKKRPVTLAEKLEQLNAHTSEQSNSRHAGGTNNIADDLEGRVYSAF